ncbi:MAG TPA: phage tail sheath C-terminal domain-containing protein [Thermoanaerobaculia bacterium]|nr:phage tail sheath C-terminal domain-containing protein [Thermoanaerobaculia bacterium]
MTALVVPGVRVEARFDILPPLPAPSGILGAVGIVDRVPPGGALIGVTKTSELRDVFGPGTEATMPEVFHALANGASEAVIAPVLGGKPASLQLLNVKSAPAVFLRCRSNGEWGNDLAAEVRATVVDGKVVRSSVRLYRNQLLAESFDDLQTESPALPNYLFDTINTRSKFVVAIDPQFANAVTLKDAQKDLPVEAAGVVIKTSTDTDAFTILPAVEPANMKITVLNSSTSSDVDIDVFQNNFKEEFRDLSLDPDSPKYLPDILLTQSRLIRVRPVQSLKGEDAYPNTSGPAQFSGGTSPTADDYKVAIEKLADDTRIDLVLASIEPTASNDDVRTIHQALLAHAIVMADAGAPRIAFGSVTADEQNDEGKIRDHAALVRNRRFVLVAPAGAEGAVAGMVGRMNPQDAPTFKGVTLFGLSPARYSESRLNKLLGPNVNLLVVQDRAGRGVVVLKGIDTTGDQVSVTRVADQAIRATKATAENFIGQLNTEDARVALKQQLIATFIRMERDGAIVPSTDGKDPSYRVDVYSTQQDFAQGIVRIDIAVRPVRSIDYIYATIRVKN